jgi:hypothetical protein
MLLTSGLAALCGWWAAALRRAFGVGAALWLAAATAAVAAFGPPGPALQFLLFMICCSLAIGVFGLAGAGLRALVHGRRAA